MEYEEVVAELKRMSIASQRDLERMYTRFGINAGNAIGLTMPEQKRFAKRLGRDHELALLLWNTNIHEAKTIAALIDDPKQVTEAQMEKWVKDFDSWDICDGCCGYLFDKTPFAYEKAVEWSKRKEEYVKRAGFVLMASLAVHDKTAGDRRFEEFLPIIRREATDDRNFVKKAVNWALRQIGKRDRRLNRLALKTAMEIKKLDSRDARWIASDAIRELTSRAVLKRL